MPARKPSPKPEKNAVLPAQNANKKNADEKLHERRTATSPTPETPKKPASNPQRNAVLPAQHANEKHSH
jgi:hypothetical protein